MDIRGDGTHSHKLCFVYDSETDSVFLRLSRYSGILIRFDCPVLRKGDA